MPYRHAWMILLAVLALTAVAFWPSYLSQLRGASFEFHAHGVTALLWMLLVTAQSWSIHAGKRTFHRQFGLASLALFPAFLGGGLLISVGMAKRLVANEGEFYELFAARLAPIDAVGVIGIGWCMYAALRDRRRVHPHARYMLATLLFLVGPISLRVLTRFGPFASQGPGDFGTVSDVLRLMTAVTLAGLAYLVWRAPRYGRPWIEAGAFVTLQAVLYETLGVWPAWQRLYPALAGVPPVPLALFGMAIGLAIVWAGWVRGARAMHPAAAAAAA